MWLFFILILFTQTNIVLPLEPEQLRQKGIHYKNTGVFDSALYYFDISLQKFQELNDSTGLANVYGNKASVESARGNYIEAYKLYQHALSIYEDQKNVKGQIKIYVNIANQQLALGNLNEALSNYLKAEKYSNQYYEKRYLGYIYNGLGSLLMSKNFKERNLDDAKKYFLEALVLLHNKSSSNDAAFIYNNLAIILEEQGLVTQAIGSYNSYLQIGLEENNPSMLVKGYHNIATLYAKTKDYELAYENLKKAEEIAIEISDPVNYIHILSNLVDVSISLGQLDEAKSYLEQYKALRDSLYNEDKTTALSELQIKYKTKEKEELLAKEIELSNERKWHTIFLTSLSLILVLAIITIVWLNRKRRVQERYSLEKQREIEILQASIEGVNKERKRLASDLHDSVGGVLTAVRMIHSSYKNDVGDNGQKVDRLLADAAETVREVSHNLSPATLERYGLSKSIEQAVDSIPDSIHVSCEVNTGEGRLPLETEKSIDFIIKELINNTVKHAHAESIELQITVIEDTLIITYEDDGNGFAQSSVKAGLGIENIRNRIGLLGGSVEINSSEGEGFLCSMEVPLT